MIKYILLYDNTEDDLTAEVFECEKIEDILNKIGMDFGLHDTLDTCNHTIVSKDFGPNEVLGWESTRYICMERYGESEYNFFLMPPFPGVVAKCCIPEDELKKHEEYFNKKEMSIIEIDEETDDLVVAEHYFPHKSLFEKIKELFKKQKEEEKPIRRVEYRLKECKCCKKVEFVSKNNLCLNCYLSEE